MSKFKNDDIAKYKKARANMLKDKLRLTEMSEEPDPNSIALKTIPEDMKDFLLDAKSGQSLNVAAWATKVLNKKTMTWADVEKAMKLGFDGPLDENAKTQRLKMTENSNQQIESLALDYLDIIGDVIQDIDASGGWQRDRRSVDFFKEQGIEPKTASQIFQKALNMNKGGSRRESMAEQKIRKIIREEIAKMKTSKSRLKEERKLTPRQIRLGSEYLVLDSDTNEQTPVRILSIKKGSDAKSDYMNKRQSQSDYQTDVLDYTITVLDLDTNKKDIWTIGPNDAIFEPK